MPGADGVVRQLVPADAPEIRAVTGGFGLADERLRQELAAADDFRWLGLTDPSGRLSAVHRSLRWGPYLFLKGVHVREDVRGSGAAMRLAFALRSAARSEGLAGIAVWYEPGMPESGIAELLGVRPGRPLVHRVTLPLPADTSSGDDRPPVVAAGRRWFRGETELPLGAASDASAVVDLFAETARGRSSSPRTRRIAWVLDGRRLVSSVSLGPDPAALAALVRALGPVARARGADTLEFPVLAADVLGALQLARAKARRRNRVPVCLGTLRFAGPSAPGGPRPAVAAEVSRAD
ncbi:hypothetical protein RM844_14210 [Streptomyces sp. DSM 44915]|uniref:N-acetyltransferase domain-containing protein n=1 Tax=Streptomyces chisholmiae TaxID=3075540 RepID=A0ABU2JRT6_9ACTN|nr:hypothetical protein [Streptomyces sp. DSM 44915]MDT0267441.1 hypothetical protein [Streptomyces sp. DSM 44915]